MATYPDKCECPAGHRFTARRRIESAGYVIQTRCPECNKYYELMAGPVPFRALKVPKAPVHERQIEDRLHKRVEEVGGEIRKVQWIGRKGAPDRLVMLPPLTTKPTVADIAKWFDLPYMVAQQLVGHVKSIPRRAAWVEVKAPGKARTFPNDAHERAQHREHERMRKKGEIVLVIDSYEQIEELLK